MKRNRTVKKPPTLNISGIQDLAGTGLLFQINRQVMNPHGLILAPDGRIFGKDNIITFDKDSFHRGTRTYNQYLKSGAREHLQKRLKALGFIVQQ